MAQADPKPEPLNPADLLRLYPTREKKLARIREIEKLLIKMEAEDDENDPELIRGHISLTRGYRMGCGVFLLCIMAMSIRVYFTGHRWTIALALVFGLAGAFMILRGLLYRPDPKLIQEAYQPHHGSPIYKSLVNEMDMLARALSQDLRAEDEEKV